MRKLTAATLLALAPVIAPTLALAEGVTHHIAMHIDESDPKVMNLALNNAENVASYYKSQGDTVVIEMVAYGPGLQMYTENSPVKDRISTMSLALDDITFAACGNTLAKMEEKAGHKVPLLSETVTVTSGVVRLVELQEQGYAYIRP